MQRQTILLAATRSKHRAISRILHHIFASSPARCLRPLCVASALGDLNAGTAFRTTGVHRCAVALLRDAFALLLMRRSSAGATVLLLSTCLPGHAVVPVPCFALLHVVFKWVSPVYVAVDSIVKWISARLIPLADFGLSFTMAHIFPLTQLPMCQPSSPAACVPTFLSCRWGLQLQFARSSMLDAVLMICDKERRRCSWRQPRATLLWSRCGSLRSNCRLRLVCSSYAPVCSRMLPYAPVCSRMLPCALVYSRMLLPLPAE